MQKHSYGVAVVRFKPALEGQYPIERAQGGAVGGGEASAPARGWPSGGGGAAASGARGSDK